MVVDLKIEFHETNNFIKETVKTFNLHEQLTGSQVTCYKLHNINFYNNAYSRRMP